MVKTKTGTIARLLPLRNAAYVLIDSLRLDAYGRHGHDQDVLRACCVDACLLRIKMTVVGRTGVGPFVDLPVHGCLAKWCL